MQTTLHDSTGTVPGSVDWTFSIQDKDLDFLGVGETLTVSTTSMCSTGFAGATQQVTITITGAQDPLVVNSVVATAADTILQDAGSVVAVAQSSSMDAAPPATQAPRSASRT